MGIICRVLFCLQGWSVAGHVTVSSSIYILNSNEQIKSEKLEIASAVEEIIVSDTANINLKKFTASNIKKTLELYTYFDNLFIKQTLDCLLSNDGQRNKRETMC